MKKIVFFGFLAMLALSPLPFASNRPWSWSLLSLVIGLLILFWGVAAWRNNNIVQVSERRLRPFIFMFAVLVLWILVQASPWTPAQWHHPAWAAAATALGEPLDDAAISIDPAMTTVALMRLLSYAAVFWLALQFGRDKARADKILWFIASIGFLYSIYGMVIEFGGYNMILWFDRWVYTDSLTSTFINRNSFATYAGLTLLAALGLVFKELRQSAAQDMTSRAGFRDLLEQLAGRLGLLLLMTATIGSALLLTGSRGGMAGFAVGIMVLSLGFTLSPGNRPTLGIIISVLCVMFIAGLITLSGDFVLSRIDATTVEAKGRMVYFPVIYNAILAEPWIGAGYGTFEVSFPMVRDASITTKFLLDKAHNSYLEFAFEAGVPALALILALLGGLVILCISGIWKRRESRLYPCVGVASAALVGSHALVDFSVQIPAVAVVFMALLGVGCAQSLRH